VDFKVKSYVYSPTRDIRLDYDKIKHERKVVKHLITNMERDELCSREKTEERPEFLVNGRGWVKIC